MTGGGDGPPPWDQETVQDLVLADSSAALAAVSAFNSWREFATHIDGHLGRGGLLNQIGQTVDGGIMSGLKADLSRELTPDRARRVLLLGGMEDALEGHVEAGRLPGGDGGLDEFTANESPDGTVADAGNGGVPEDVLRGLAEQIKERPGRDLQRDALIESTELLVEEFGPSREVLDPAVGRLAELVFGPGHGIKPANVVRVAKERVEEAEESDS